MPAFVTTLSENKTEQLRSVLQEEGFAFEATPYAHFCAKKKGVSVTLYHSGKLVVQGKEQDAFIEFVLEPRVLQTFTYKQPKEMVPAHIGVDESGKGDVFGPLCIAGVYADEKGIKLLEEKQMRDSKKMSDKTILAASRWIRKEFAHVIVRIFPRRYNELYRQFRNLNHLLAWGHATVIVALAEQTGCSLAWVDQFASEHVLEKALAQKNCTVSLFQRHRAEEDPVVAAASILARAAFLEGLSELEQKYQIHLPKGASAKTIEAGRAFLQKHGEELLPEIAKQHFKTIQAICDIPK